MNDTFSMFRRRRSNLALDDLVSQTLVGWIRFASRPATWLQSFIVVLPLLVL